MYAKYTRRGKRRKIAIASGNNKDNRNFVQVQNICDTNSNGMCLQRARISCTFQMEIGKVTKTVGCGRVISQISYLRGGRIPSIHVLVSFTEFIEVEHSECFPAQVTTLNQRSSTPILWDKSGVSRVSLIGPLGDCVGSAILVDEHPNHDSIKSGIAAKKLLSSEGQLDIDCAAVICGININEANATFSIPYLCQQWYSAEGLEHLRSLHFKTKIVPETLGELHRS